MNQKYIAVLAIGLAVIVLVAMNALFVVSQTQTALVTQFGRPVAVIGEPGLKFKIPFVQSVEYFDRRILEYRMPRAMEINASDQKRLVVGAFMKWRVVDSLKFAQTTKASGFGSDRVAVMNDRLANILESSLRQVLGGAPLNALLMPGGRNKLMREIKDLVNEQASSLSVELGNEKSAANTTGYGIEIVDVRIVRADLPAENSNAIFRRMQTEREREAKEFRAKGEEEALRIRSKAEKDRTVLIAEAQKKAETVRGEGDAAAAKIYAANFGKDPQFFEFYRTMQAYQRTLNAKDTTIIMSPGNKFLRQLESGGQ